VSKASRLIVREYSSNGKLRHDEYHAHLLLTCHMAFVVFEKLLILW